MGVVGVSLVRDRMASVVGAMPCFVPKKLDKNKGLMGCQLFEKNKNRKIETKISIADLRGFVEACRSWFFV